MIHYVNKTHSVVTSIAYKLQLDNSLFTFIFSRFVVFETSDDIESNFNDLLIASKSSLSNLVVLHFRSYFKNK